MLKRDHRKVGELFNDFHGQKSDDDRKRIAEKIFKNFEVHAKVEEEIFYPEVRGVSQEGEGMIRHAIEEHQKVRDMINELRGSDVSRSMDWEKKIVEMHKVIDDHVSEEESKVFPFAESNIKDKLGIGMSAKFMAIKTKEMI